MYGLGRRVMRSAADRLVPVTLELGGKCPTIVGRSARLVQAVDRLLLAKSINGGQICLAPDYVLLPRERLEDFVATARLWWSRHFDARGFSADSTAVISATHAHRLRAWIDEARELGATVECLGIDDHAPADGTREVDARLLPLTLVTNVPADARLAREEIFGPVLPLLPYDDIEAAISHVRSKPRPLALYYFGSDRGE